MHYFLPHLDKLEICEEVDFIEESDRVNCIIECWVILEVFLNLGKT
jgi:hypothetical protein